MDNEQPGVGTGTPQPISNQPLNPAPSSPIPNNPASTTQSTPGYTPNPYGDPNGGGFTSPSGSGDIVLQSDTKQKKRKGLIIGLVCLFIVLLGGGGFAAAYMIANQPNNIALSAFDHLMNAEQVQIAGSFNASFDNDNLLGIKSFDINFDDTSTSSGQTATISAKLALDGVPDTISLDLGEAMLSNGVFYLKADGLKTLYYDTFYDQIHNYVYSGLLSSYQGSLLTACYDGVESDGAAYQACLDTYSTDLNPEAGAALDAVVADVMTEFGGIIDAVDGQWIEFSVDDILSSDLLSLDSTTRQTISSTYNCVTDKLTHFSQYSSELSDLYSQDPFLNMTSGQDGFYDLTIDADRFAGYVNSLSRSQTVKDFATCTGTTVDDSSISDVTASDVQPALSYLPRISAKFDSNLFSHSLSELKINESNSGYTVNSDLKFTYPTNAAVTAPSDARPVMDLVTEIYDRINSLQTIFYSF